jgi:hypothetical protein
MKLCELCDREIPEGKESMHHLKPKTFKGKRDDDNMVALHQICHDMIHRTFTERELLHHYHTVEDLRGHEEIQKFAKWVFKQPIDFYVKSKETKQRKGKRRR